VEPLTAADGEKIAAALRVLAEEDPSFRVAQDPESGQTLIRGIWALHANFQPRTLIGQARPVQVKRVERDGIVSWLGELDSAGRETLVFSVSAQLPGDPAPLVADFTRELHGAD